MPRTVLLTWPLFLLQLIAHGDAQIDAFNSLVWPAIKGVPGVGSRSCGDGDLLCNSAGNITYIGLRSSELSGSIPSEVALLWSLNWLDLSRNALTGEIPSELGRLQSLEYLKLHENSLGGTIPSELAQAPLKSLWLQRNTLEGPVPTEFSELSLIELMLDRNRLCGRLPMLSIAASCNLVWPGFPEANCFECDMGMVINPVACDANSLDASHCECQCFGTQTSTPVQTGGASDTTASDGGTQPTPAPTTLFAERTDNRLRSTQNAGGPDLTVYVIVGAVVFLLIIVGIVALIVCLLRRADQSGASMHGAVLATPARRSSHRSLASASNTRRSARAAPQSRRSTHSRSRKSWRNETSTYALPPSTSSPTFGTFDSTATIYS